MVDPKHLLVLRQSRLANAHRYTFTN